MKAAVFYGKEKMKVSDIEKKKPAKNEVMIKVEACGVCGTDIHIYEGAEGAAKTTPPTVLGHEFSGLICEIGSNVKSVKVGDRVCIDPNDMCGECFFCRQGQAHFCEHMIGIGTTVNGGFAEYCTVHEKQVYKISDHLSFAEAAMAEPLACCLHGVDLINIKPGQNVMIVGGGTIGLIMLQLAKICGAAQLVLVEPVELKRKRATELGATIVLDPFKENTEDTIHDQCIKNIHAVIECVGSKDTMQYAIKHTGKGGTSMLFGLTEPKAAMEIYPFDIFKNEITIKTSFINPYTQGRAIQLLEQGIINVKNLISDEVRLDHIEDIFSTDQYKGRGKIIVKPWA